MTINLPKTVSAYSMELPPEITVHYDSIITDKNGNLTVNASYVEMNQKVSVMKPREYDFPRLSCLPEVFKDLPCEEDETL